MTGGSLAMELDPPIPVRRPARWVAWVAWLVLAGAIAWVGWSAASRPAQEDSGSTIVPPGRDGASPPVLAGPGSRRMEATTTQDASSQTGAVPAAMEAAEAVEAPTTGTRVVEGVVRDAETGRSVADVRVVAHYRNEADPYESERRVTFSAVSDGLGFFRISLSGEREGDKVHLGVEGKWLLARRRWEEDARAVITVARPFRLKGIVVDEEGRPVDDVDFLGGSEPSSKTGADGRFDIGAFADDPVLMRGAGASSEVWAVSVFASGFAATRLDPYAVPRERRGDVRVVLTRGFHVGGVLVDEAGHPLEGVDVEVTDSELGGHARTDGEGRWRVDELNPGAVTILVRAFRKDAAARREIVLTRDVDDMRLVAEPIHLPAGIRRVPVLGLVLADADDELRAAYLLPKYVRVVILDPGPYERALERPGGLEPGDGVRLVGRKRIASVRDVLVQILDGARQVETYATHGDGTNGVARLRATDEDLANLWTLLDTLPR